VTKTVTLVIDGRKVTAPAGTTVLWAALDNGIYIPNLCAIRGKEEPSASCRLCWVEVEGSPRPQPACTVTVKEGMAVSTTGEQARELAKTAFELLMASHDLDCAHCPANRRCELQTIAKHLKVSLKPKRFRKFLKEMPVDETNPLFTYNPDRCVLCGRCVWTCRNKVPSGVLGFAFRGFDRRLTTFCDEPIGPNRCLDCDACVKVCPTGALALREAPPEQPAKKEKRP
jgi:bidirectional [NiFe] hydrogenase diaphorase subunit